MPPDHVNLIRLVWHPGQYDNGELTPAAIENRDLRPGSFVSVDREDMFNEGVVRARALKQQGNINQAKNRRSALLFSLPCGGVRVAQDSNGTFPFSVTSEPLPENPAHCGIHNISGRTDRAYFNELRADVLYPLMKQLRELILVDDL